MMDSQKAYVFTVSDVRPSKRRRVEPDGLSSSWPLRQQTFKELWNGQRKNIDSLVDKANQGTLDDVEIFLDEALEANLQAPRDQTRPRLPAAFVLGGPSLSEHAAFLRQLMMRVGEAESRCFVQLCSAECTNLKALLKTVIAKAIMTRGEWDQTSRSQGKERGPKTLNYDLQLLYDWSVDNEVQQIVVAFQDSEAFDGALLAEAVEILSVWLKKINFVLLFGIATSVENFQDKLPRSVIPFIEGQKFDIMQTDEVLEQVYCMCYDSPLKLGPQLSGFLLDRHKDNIQSVQDFLNGLQYAYMCHFFANPLSVLLAPGLSSGDVSKEHFEAIRNLPSFQQIAERLLGEPGGIHLVQSLLDSDAALFEFVWEHLQTAQSSLADLIVALDLWCDCLNLLERPATRSDLYIRGLSGEGVDSPLFREFLLSVKRAPSDVFDLMLGAVVDCLDPEDEACKEAQRLLKTLHALLQSTGNDEPLQSQQNETLQTTIVGKKVQLSKQKAALSESDAQYAEILQSFHDWLNAFFTQRFVSIKDLFLREIVIYDIRPPHRAVFAPKTRFAVERALSSPHDYLNCECCKLDANGESALAWTQPATASLYQLYLESGPLINANDLWSAFNGMRESEEDESDERAAMPHFQRALAELKYLGFTKSTRRKADHVAKVLWKGL